MKKTKPKIVVEVYLSSGGWRWHAVINGKIVAESGEGYKNKAHAIKMANKLFPNKRVARVFLAPAF